MIFDLLYIHKNKIYDLKDWRNSDCVSDPQDQGLCGANWAFGVVGSIESLLCLQNKNVLQTLSVQQLIDCTYGVDGNEGCDGGLFKPCWLNLLFLLFQLFVSS